MEASNIKIQFLKFSVILKQRNIIVVTYLNRLCRFIHVGREMDSDHGVCLVSKHLQGKKAGHQCMKYIWELFNYVSSQYSLQQSTQGIYLTLHCLLQFPVLRALNLDNWSHSSSPQTKVPHKRAVSTFDVTVGSQRVPQYSLLKCFWVFFGPDTQQSHQHSTQKSLW